MNRASANKSNGLLLAAAFLVVGGGAYFMGRQSPKPVAAGEASKPEPAKPAESAASKGLVKLEGETLKLAKLEMGSPRMGSIAPQTAVTGEVEANLTGLVKVTPRTEGKVIQILVNVGDTVSAGQTLAVIQSEKLHEAQITYRLALKKVDLAKSTLERRKKLAALGEYRAPNSEEARNRLVIVEGEIQKGENDVSAARSAVDTSRSMVAETESGLQALRATQTQAQAKLETARTRANRADALYKEQLMSRQDWETAHAEVRQAESDVEAAKANIGQGEAKVKSAQSALSGAQSAFAASQATLAAAVRRRDVAMSAFNRSEAVYKGNFLSSKEVSEAETAYEQAKIEADGALDDIDLLGGKPGDLHSIPVLAPISGKVTERLVTLGETVAADKALLVVLNSQSVWVQLNVFPKDTAGLGVGQEVRVKSDSVPNRVFTGRVSYISVTADEATRTVKVRCVIQNSGGLLKPGAFVNADIVGTAGATALTVPKEAVQYVDGKPVVYVPTSKEGEFRETAVVVGETIGDITEIRSGLQAGDRLVTKNAFLVKSQAMKAELGEE